MTQLRPVRWLRDHPVQSDVALAIVIAAFSVLSHLTIRDASHDGPSILGVLLILGATLPLAWRRQAPGRVLATVLLFQFALEINSSLGTGWINMLVAAYSVGAHRSGRTVWLIGGVSSALVLGFVSLGVVDDQVQWQAVISTTVLFSASVVVGDNMRRRRERAAELVERAERAERERELVATQRVQQERTRIARELHDVVAHSVSVMIIQAGAARRQVVSNPQQAIGVLETIETTGREAMSEMRRVLGVLRTDDLNGSSDGYSPQPSLTSLGDLMTATSDLPVSLHTEGDIIGLPPGVELSAYRVVQEALTNVRRHAGRVDRVDVAVTHADETLVVEVTDNGRGGTSQPGSRAGLAGATTVGFGIAGMRERVSMFGGSLNAGPRQGGGWRVRATFPLPSP
ncbi:MAG: putative two-component histidine kinase [Ilumatobacteraceae bacterium]|nr:putative two-component histidine kinase [Ilumatobacteraceae bacterium]